VNKHATAKLKDEIRCAKQFFKAQGLYGAETHIKGFSGYVLEILTIYYGSFAQLIKAAAKWKEAERIDYTGHYGGLNTSKKSPLIVIDPVQAERNAAAALSKEKFEKAKNAAKEFLKTKEDCMFIVREKTKKDFEKIYDLVTKITYKPGKKDVVATQALKKYERIVHVMTKEGFTITAAEFYPQEKSALVGISVQEKEIPLTYQAQGPPLALKEHVLLFRKKHKGKKIIEKDKRVYVELKRKYHQAEKAFEEISKVKDR
jgi:tRNA nucleotidyltransferase (CCA-adding enzyme)